ncbi:MAG: TrmH family RNA methyltransferase [Gammaproteobacteria bacterium]|nr:TrmH family RNA methyltransferase [Gammaproteobacteria bacterium]
MYEQQKLKQADGLIKRAPAILLAGLSKTENIGAAYRLADAAGCEKIFILQEEDKSLDQKTLQRVSRSTVNTMQTISISLEELHREYSNWPPMIAIEITSTSTSILETQLPNQCIFVIGNEKHGIAEDVLTLCTSSVHIPMFGTNGSMNVSHALAIVLYEWRRQFS